MPAISRFPFGAERLTSIREIEFARRSVVTETLTPDRDTGVQLSGRLFGDALTYMAGAFRHDGSGPPHDGDGQVGRRADARRTRRRRAVCRLRRRSYCDGSRPAFGYTTGDISEGLNSPCAPDVHRIRSVRTGLRVRHTSARGPGCEPHPRTVSPFAGSFFGCGISGSGQGLLGRRPSRPGCRRLARQRGVDGDRRVEEQRDEPATITLQRRHRCDPVRRSYSKPWDSTATRRWTTRSGTRVRRTSSPTTIGPGRLGSTGSRCGM